jgi:hypothetical protein
VTDVNSDNTLSFTTAGASPARSASQAHSSTATHELMAPEQNVQRIMWTGTVWFAAAVGAVAVVLGLLLSSGWRPALLTGGVRVLFWAASAVVTLSIGLIGWSGCPILEVDVPTADRNKSHTMQLGTMLFIVGSAFALLAVLLGPAA